MLQDSALKIYNFLKEHPGTPYSYKEMSEATKVPLWDTEFISKTLLRQDSTHISNFYKERMFKEIQLTYNIYTKTLKEMTNKELISKYINVCLKKVYKKRPD